MPGLRQAPERLRDPARVSPRTALLCGLRKTVAQCKVVGWGRLYISLSFEASYARIFARIRMKTLQTHFKTSPQGILHIAMQTGLTNADVEVILIVNETSANGAAKPVDRDAWNKFVDETAGAWESEFVRPAQGEFEQREPFV